MTVERIDAVTGEVVELTEAEARRLTERIRSALDRVSTAWADLAERITEAYQRRADLALGYGSWAEYAEAELTPAEGLAANVRRQLVGMLSAQGMSTRAIAPTVGVQHSAVAKDLRRAGVSVGHTSPAPAEVIDHATGEVLDLDTHRREVLTDAEQNGHIVALTGPASVTTPGRVVGLDGKTYTRPEPKTTEPRRAALPPMVQSAGWDLTKSIERLQRLAADDRFNAHKKEMAPHLRSHLTSAIEACQDLLDRISN